MVYGWFMDGLWMFREFRCEFHFFHSGTRGWYAISLSSSRILVFPDHLECNQLEHGTFSTLNISQPVFSMKQFFLMGIAIIIIIMIVIIVRSNVCKPNNRQPPISPDVVGKNHPQMGGIIFGFTTLA